MGKIWRVSGPLVVAEGMRGSKVYEVVQVGDEGLIGEVIGLDGDQAVIQTHEETQGLKIGENVTPTGRILTVDLGPGLIGSIYDGLQKSLLTLIENSGHFIKRGATSEALSPSAKWDFQPVLKVGDRVQGGDIIGVVPETELVAHKIMVPPDMGGVITELNKGAYTIEDMICRLENNGDKTDLTLMQKWPVRKPRPYRSRRDPTDLLVTGMRIIDYMFPLSLGGKAGIPGGFGTGKTVTLQQLARYAQTHLNIYVGCGERGNEMADVLYSFQDLTDPLTGRPLKEKEIFIANTSNMPVVAREVSIFVGITIGEYFRDMGYDVLLVADSTSRWAEAMRELGGRLEEMPGEEGFPAYMGSRLSAFYERAGRVETVGSPDRVGSLTAMGAVSPPGADFSEPVTQTTLRIIEALYSLDVSLANKRHFPAISWLSSYSLYVGSTKEWWDKIDTAWEDTRNSAMRILQKEAELEEIVRLVGPEAMPEADKLLLLSAKMLREDFLMQNAYHHIDTYCAPKRAHLMMKTMMRFYELSQGMMESGMTVAEIRQSPMITKISRMKDIENDVFEDKVKELWAEMESGLVAR
ncbi:MAG: V-type ATP synthase subunit A [Chloroflexi bacterium]|jgi:V/A-type H+/Na+-transporting ATPase subunit A|nr:V-type ATP synthase subunit A [Chloroflexota bacterium]MBT7080942.1 V-type ATP synthase subunit A [Chloroflexota bacterium]MBT7290057.1 V-type ATP synthase subunit A [Chloroflexota bacterium]